MRVSLFAFYLRHISVDIEFMVIFIEIYEYLYQRQNTISLSGFNSWLKTNSVLCFVNSHPKWQCQSEKKICAVIHYSAANFLCCSAHMVSSYKNKWRKIIPAVLLCHTLIGHTTSLSLILLSHLLPTIGGQSMTNKP